MKYRHVLLAAGVAAAFSISVPAIASEKYAHAAPTAAHSHDAHAVHAGVQRISLDPRGSRWGSDEALRKGMEQIRSAVLTYRVNVHQPEQRIALARALEANIGLIVANCKLSPEADRNLHVVLGELESAVSALKGGSAPDAALATVRATQALNEYGHFFDHPGWQPLV